MKFTVSLLKINRLLYIDLSKFYLIDKRAVSVACYLLGMTILYFGSLHPWFLWPLKELYPIPASFFLIVSYLVSNSMKITLFSRDGALSGIMCYVVVTFYIIINAGQNANAYIVNVFSILSVCVLLKSNMKLLDFMVTSIAKIFALLLIPSMFFFLLYLAGFALPGKNVVFGDNQYSFTNYFFFMIDDRSLSVIIPRFQSVFLEPGHLGSATTVLLMTQIGKWKKWWNVVLIIASVISFSLAAYAILLTLVFLGLWMQRRNILRKVVLIVAMVGAIMLMATFYNQGDNMVNNLIIARLEVDESTGDIVGNNRVDVSFEKEFDKYVTTSDVFCGRDMAKVASGSGNSGYRVFVYQHGLVGLFLLILFYGFSFSKYRDVRYMLSAVCVSILIFWIRGYPLWYSNFIPIFVTVYQKYNGCVNKLQNNSDIIKIV